MIARKVQDLIVWQLATQIQDAALEISAAPAVRRQYKFCSQFESAARSIPANVAEGFARFTPSDFARFLRYARGSLGELEVYISEARKRGWMSEDQLAGFDRLCRRFTVACIRLTKYLDDLGTRPAPRRRP